MRSPLISAAEGLDKHAAMVEGWADRAYEGAVARAPGRYSGPSSFDKEAQYRADATVLRQAADWLREKAGG